MSNPTNALEALREIARLCMFREVFDPANPDPDTAALEAIANIADRFVRQAVPDSEKPSAQAVGLDL